MPGVSNRAVLPPENTAQQRKAGVGTAAAGLELASMLEQIIPVGVCSQTFRERGPYMRIKICKIRVKPGRRAKIPEHIEELSKSIAEVGLLNPITLDQDYTLIAGLHRLEAVKLLGWEEVECTVTSLEGLQAELAEIDENIIRSDFSSMEANDLLLRRKELYETLHPETQHGKRNGQTSKNEDSSFLAPKSFTQDTAEKLGVSRRTVEKKIKIARDLTPETKKIIVENNIGSESALKLSRLPPEQQQEAATRLANGTIKAVEDYQFPQRDIPPQSVESLPPVPEQTVASKPVGQETVEEIGVPFSVGRKRFATFQESVADLKDPNKDCSCTPDSFLAEISEFVKKFHKEIEWFHFPYYEAAILNLTQVQRDYFQAQLDSVHAAVEALCNQVMKGKVQNGQKE